MPTTCPDDQTPETLPLMARSPNETKPTQFRLGQDTLDMLDAIAAHYGLASRADALRIATKTLHDQIAKPKPRPKGRPKKPA